MQINKHFAYFPEQSKKKKKETFVRKNKYFWQIIKMQC